MSFSAEPYYPLVQVEWLLKHTNDPQLRLLDCRNLLADPSAGHQAFLAGHIQGAVHASLSEHLSGPTLESGTGGRHPLPDPQVMADWLGSVGIDNNSHIICYDDPSTGQGFYASRAWWLLRWLGHGRVQVLDGGWPAYQKAQGKTSTKMALPSSTTFIPQVQPQLVVNAEQVQRREAQTKLIDSRAASRYRGNSEAIDPKAGHIPGAINREWAEAFNEQGHWKPAVAQVERLQLGDTHSIFYCGSGISATPNLLARELAGVPLGQNSQLYSGSWSDWISDDSREVEKGTIED